MDYRLIYTETALNDLEEIIGHIAEDDSDAASSLGRSLLAHVDLLARFPQMGGAIRKRAGIRKLIHSPYVIYYSVDAGERVAEVLHIRHGARKPPKYSSL